MKTLTLTAALALAFAGIAHSAEPVFPKDLPPYGEAKPLPPLPVDQHVLPNGLTVWIVPRQGMPKITAVLTLLGGTAADPANAPAVSDLFSGLLDAGTTTRSSQQLAEQWQAIGGEFSSGSSADAITLRGTALASHAPVLMDLLGDIALHSTFPDKEVALGKANALQELKASEGEPAWQASRAFATALYGDHPYARIVPTEASIEAATPASLRAEYAQRARPDRALLVIVGKIDAVKALALATATFGHWKASGAPSTETPAVPVDVKPVRVLVQRDGSVQSAIRMGHPAVSANNVDYVPLTVANMIFGGSFSSRLTEDIREDKGYTYSPGSIVTPRRAGSELRVVADVRNEVTGPTLDEVDKLLRGMATQPASDEELVGAKRLIAGLYLYRNQQQRSLATTLATTWTYKLPASFVTEYVEKTSQVTAEQVTAIGSRYFDPALQSIVIVGDEKAIDSQLKAHGNFRVVKP
ncbi:putative Zn-dependent peptidase [Luteibacter rhizovicinus]|uniref:Putative Zn-dependent peptidase n=1 Tax=Luteibacter rhizovicinus TaxID=242606 RepID=A0A4R3YPJ3_9GAMM|nr:pitrilysin family protein [Luteibacter rhizovicinus]TCV94815.1 putative Zn-dependent peptidase [Luteibacter rhizovicinus]